MMSTEIYEQNRDVAVPEPIVAGTDVPEGLNAVERQLYALILRDARGRLEQEFLPENIVHEAIDRWCHPNSPRSTEPSSFL